MCKVNEEKEEEEEEGKRKKMMLKERGTAAYTSMYLEAEGR